MPSTSSRAVAVAAVAAVEAGAFTDAALRDALADAELESGAAARATALATLAVRLRQRCDLVLQPRCSRPVEELDPWLRATLRVGAVELLWTDRHHTPSAVHGLVEVAKQTGRRELAGFANAVLRRIAEQAERLRQPPDTLSFETDPAGWLTGWESHPRWLVERWLAAVGADAALERCRAGNREPSLAVRRNPLRVGPEAFDAALSAAGVAARRGALVPEAWVLPSSRDVTQLPGFAEGWFTVQDEAAMCIAPVTGVQPGCRVIDLCAAPGGKATHLAELMGDRGEVIACDRNAGRLSRVEETVRRLGLSCVRTRAADARALPKVLLQADAVLLDAPCTGTGTLARRADLRWRLHPDRLIEAAAALTRLGGVLVYATCSLEPEENEAQMSWLAERRPDLVPDADAQWPAGADREQAWARIEPSEAGWDGMFVARRRRVP
ncbi:MAG: methyltransferase domain-containing protein [Armatimonadetes bacterium]|nr:methyltransferase domain-containing protein [Armatimonadota bacterium]